MPHPSGGNEMPDWLSRRASTLPNRPAVISGEDRWSFGDLEGTARRTARRLAALGVTEGTYVACAVRNGAPAAALTHALTKLGAVMVPLNVRMAAAEFAWQIEDSRAGVLIFDHRLADLVAEAVRRRRDLVLAHLGGAPVEASGLAGRTRSLEAIPEADAPIRQRIDLSAVQSITYTSATSGRPKGVQLTYGNHWWSAIGSALNLGLVPGDRWLAPLPLYHVGGLALLWRSVIYGMPVVIHETFDADAVNREIDTGGATLVSLVSTMLRRILDARGARAFPPTLRAILLGGGPVPPTLLTECIDRGVPVVPSYGLTETSSQVAALAPGEAARKPGSSGRALLPAELMIETDGRSSEPGEVGEILVRGPNVMLGYAGRPTETGAALRGGWLHTGDLGYLDREGYLYVVDRRDDLIVSGGENVYPTEVEWALLGHPAIQDAAVVGLPDPEWGQRVVAVITSRPGSRITEAEVKQFCAAHLARHKIPKQVMFSDVAARSGSGKARRVAIRAWAAAQDSEALG
jgi:o-succinylbenzoate---CoA ligase